MIHIELVLDKDSVLVSCNAQGHAGYAGRGFDIVCSAVTVLIRTVYDVLSSHGCIVLNSDVLLRGKLAFYVESYCASEVECLKTAGEFLGKGLKSLQKEYPQYVELREIKNN